MPTSITLGTYKTWTRNKLNRASFDTNKLTQFANEANKEICNNRPWRFMETLFTGTIAAGFTDYDLPTDFQALINFRLIDPDANATYLEYVPYEVWDEKYPDPTALAEAAPTQWTSFGPAIIVGPARPDQNYTMQLRYLKEPTVMAADSDLPDITDDFAEILVLGMTRRALEATDNYNEAQVIYQEWSDLMDQMSERLQSRQFGSPMRMGRSANNQLRTR
jgi:hypothetical protein